MANPRLLKQLSMTLLPGGHTTTCVDGCNYTWTAEPGWLDLLLAGLKADELVGEGEEVEFRTFA